MDKKIATIKRRLRRHNAWHYNYFDDMVESSLRTIGNVLANKGPRAQVKHLMANGFTVDEIVDEGKRIKKIIVKHMKGTVRDTKHRHSHTR